MPQISVAHAVARVRVLEGRLLKMDQIERLLQAPSLADAQKLMEEYGYAGAADYDAAIKNAKKEQTDFLKEVTPDQALTDGFLLENDINNLKVLIKAKALSMDGEALCSDTGSIELKTLAKAVDEQEYRNLPEALQRALKEIDAAINIRMDPGLIDSVLDRTWAEMAHALLKKNKTLKTYITEKIDLTNLRSALRARRAELPVELAKTQLLPGGEIAVDSIVSLMEEPEKMFRLYEQKPYYKQLLPMAEKAAQDGQFQGLEKLQDDYLLDLFIQKRHETIAIEPLIGFYFGKMREMEMIRLMMAAKANGFSDDAVRERLREIYG